ncbi:hypothetical protein Rt10032_c10g4136 [Rhodotorula toruloides]|uniref:DUF1748-domain-containing protein n=1 Tax=Rhodotorula toruloides TaxID=5286 RepID=A0A511KIB4_RHOTO|nr:hypothetical protein Rt10032_c10g4136 [Rhodotorula toruloides]
MVLGRLMHYTFDIALVTTVLAGVKRHTGFQVNTSSIPEGPFRQTADVVLGTGERLFDFASAMSYTSSLFERETPKPK